MSWSASSLRDAIRRNEVTLKENLDKSVKSECWKSFRILEQSDGREIFGWCCCNRCYCCIQYKAVKDDSVKLFGTKNMIDHMRTCVSLSNSLQPTLKSYLKPAHHKFPNVECKAIKDAEVKMVVQGGTSFHFVENVGLREFAQLMVQMGSKYGNIDVADLLYSRQTIQRSTFLKMKECQELIRCKVAQYGQQKCVSFTTDLTTDDVNKNSFMDFTVFWITEDYELCHAMYKCEYFEQRHTGYNIKQAIDSILSELNLDIYDTPCTTDKGSNIIAATTDKTHVDCLCHRLNTVIDSAWKEILQLNEELMYLDQFCHELVRFVNHSSGIQSNLPSTLKHGGLTRPWRSLSNMFVSILKSREALLFELRNRKREHLISRINIDLLRDVVDFLEPLSTFFDMLEFANVPTLQNGLPVYYTLYETWKPNDSDNTIITTLKSKFLKFLTEKFWSSLGMLHFVATYLDPSLRYFAFVTSVADRNLFLVQVLESIHVLSEDITLDDMGCASKDVTNEPETECMGEATPTKKKKTNPFSWFYSIEMASQKSTDGMQCSESLRGTIETELFQYNLEKVPQPRVGYNPLEWWEEKHTLS
ncbi:Hobo element transposase HFL1 [Oopsacas minuta]|uniref:Hobo element transposase HFL1 n=1 Tax=Oopsacas minuta TaxID=111878 RepID=A0AAV7KL60_9METZ|nr:Hobo element transposase HFL1 [Oopsacas minuta]